MFWNHSKQHSSKTRYEYTLIFSSFGTIRNNTALKHLRGIKDIITGFGTIRNNTALKHDDDADVTGQVLEPFETTQL